MHRGSKGHGLSALTNAQAPSFYTSLQSKHGVLHHSCFGQIKVTILILIFVIIHPASSQIVPLAVSLCISSHRISACAEHRLFLCVGGAFQGSKLSQESLCALKESSGLTTLNIDLLSHTGQQVNSKQTHQWPFKSVTALSSPRICDKKKVKKKKRRLVTALKHPVKQHVGISLKL